MALFFDQQWFDKRLETVRRSREDVAARLDLTSEQVAEIWKDQRELLPHEVSALADLLEAAPAEVADHAGVSTPVPPVSGDGDLKAVLARLDEVNGRLMRMERAVADLKMLVLEQRQNEKDPF
mgnify:CR=1 FL=1